VTGELKSIVLNSKIFRGTRKIYANEAPVSEIDSNRSGSEAISILAEMFHGYGYG
jgi:hypothetical protein